MKGQQGLKTTPTLQVYHDMNTIREAYFKLVFPETFKQQCQIQANACSICEKNGSVGLHLRNSEGCRWQYCLLLGLAENSEVPKVMSERTKKLRPTDNVEEQDEGPARNEDRNNLAGIS